MPKNLYNIIIIQQISFIIIYKYKIHGSLIDYVILYAVAELINSAP